MNQREKAFLDTIATRLPLYQFMQIEDAIKRGVLDLSDLRERIISASAHAIFDNAWDLREENRREDKRNYKKKPLPSRVPKQAFVEANTIFRDMEKLNGGIPVEALWFIAANQEGHRYTKEDPTPDRFGHYFTMQSLGHGISWWDFYPETNPRIEVPRHEDFYAGIF